MTRAAALSLGGDALPDGEDIQIRFAHAHAHAHAGADALAAGYRALPASGSGIAVLVVHEAWGLVDELRECCDRLAREGFVALAPDLFDGRVTRDQQEARDWVAALDLERALAILAGAQQSLLGHEAVESSDIGIVGFCMGGQLALAAACESEGIAAVVDCYGVHPDVALDLSRLRAPVLGIFAEHDDWIPAERVRELENDLEAAGQRCHFSTHLGVQHGFMNPARAEAYDAATSEEAWKQLIAFLRAELPAPR
jgi:carboxymethylenebutenolidase